MSKILAIFGATGNQGGSLVEYVLADPVLSKEYNIRAITRDASSPAAKTLQNRGIEVVAAKDYEVATLSEALKGTHTVSHSLVLCIPFSDLERYQREPFPPMTEFINLEQFECHPTPTSDQKSTPLTFPPPGIQRDNNNLRRIPQSPRIQPRQSHRRRRRLCRSLVHHLQHAGASKYAQRWKDDSRFSRSQSGNRRLYPLATDQIRILRPGRLHAELHRS